MGNFDSPCSEILIGINGFADTTPGAVEQQRQPVRASPPFHTPRGVVGRDCPKFESDIPYESYLDVQRKPEVSMLKHL